MSKLDFETSKDLKILFNEHFDRWKRRNHGGLEELAERCGVSPAYLAHVGRYGRIPGKPVLLLLAFNFELENCQRILDAAGMKDVWPYPNDIGLNKSESRNSGLLSIKLDMDGFTEAIRAVVRSENKQRSLKDLMGRRPLRIGLNFSQKWMFDEILPTGKDRPQGFFPEFCEMLGVALQREIETVTTRFGDYVEMLSRGEIDMYGPLMAAPHSSKEIPFTAPLYKIGVSAVMRKRPTEDLEPLPVPEKADDLVRRDYKIAVLKDSLPHLLANTRWKRPDSQLIVCESDEEAVDRIVLRGIKRPAHIFICNALLAKRIKSEQKELHLLFNSRESILDLADDSLAVRPDWPEFLPVVNEAIRFLMSRGGLSTRTSLSVRPPVSARHRRAARVSRPRLSPYL
jgi:hypothetical protein